MRKLRLLAAAGLLLSLLASGVVSLNAQAHSFETSHLDVMEQDGHTNVSLAIHPQALPIFRLIDLDADGRLSETEFSSARASLQLAFAEYVLFSAECTRLPATAQLDTTTAMIVFEQTIQCAAPATRLSFIDVALMRRLPASHQCFATWVVWPSERTQRVLTPQQPRWDQQGRGSTLLGACLSGALHFLSGWDHVLFLIVLLLSGEVWTRTLGALSGFTLGHSISLSLVAFDQLHVQPRWVESAIALSIAAAAWLALRERKGLGFVLLASGCGLIHGMGFASATELNGVRAELAVLVGFNLGLECAQIALCVGVWSLLRLIRRASVFAPARARVRTVALSVAVIVGLCAAVVRWVEPSAG